MPPEATSRTLSGSFLFCAVLFCAVEFGDFVPMRDEDNAGTVDEETMLDDAGDVAEFAR